jgi:S-methylmethionine-dependent homocysteine/selenocysteine methylase
VGVIILDGPMGTELSRRGVALPPHAWSAAALDTAPDVVAAVHRAYATAGATVHTANTFRTQPGSGGQWAHAARRAVELARSSVPQGHRVAGSLAPVEDCYRPDLSPGAATRSAHEALARVLADAGVDLLLCETFAHAVEAAVAVEVCARTGIPTWAALTAGYDGSLMTPSSMRAAARDCVRAGASAVLVDCTPASRTLAFVEAIAEAGVPFGAYANAGSPGEGLGWSAAPGLAARGYARHAASWIEAGATLVGGCCGTRPEHIEAIRDLTRVSG